MELLKVEKLKDAQDKLYSKCIESGFCVEKCFVDIKESLGMIVANDVKSCRNVPSFRRSTVDGYAVFSSDLGGASESAPSFLMVIGESKMGISCDFKINHGECVYVPTGAMVPDGADAVVMVEWVENFTDNKIAIYQSIASGKNIVNIGDDNKEGDILLYKGNKITVSDIGLLSSNGIKKVEVFKPFDISIISTGDEIVDIDKEKKEAEIYDINSYTLEAECKKNLYNIKNINLLKDDKELLKEKIANDMKISNVVVISGGSSKGKKDSTAASIDELCSSGVLVHGIAVKPGKPTIIGYDEKTNCVVIGLPGHPIAAVLLFRLLVVFLYSKLTGYDKFENKIKVKGKLSENIMQSQGRTTFQLVNIDDKYNVRPIFAKSGLINAMSKADGYIVIDENCEGLNVGEEVNVFLF